MVIGDNGNKIPYKVTLSKLVHQLMKSIFANFCMLMTFIHYLISKNIIPITFCQHCKCEILYFNIRFIRNKPVEIDALLEENLKEYKDNASLIVKTVTKEVHIM